ncbi:hypothetical protein PHLGIDRAFT_122619 [Phlebiopsis gigantea 11061_1 CR5-6]|uniref:Uncharacterized protein n=1 Tax=Phlebiopsis gigantea (strain 11061_1 CR5-6) TaxID=745531 RepID=A0A0C3NCJ1_PHLG1|nr:hypothetical protein PHLGIDRAFT_122619 [Phlebiopsis gigantea 11061_1 CR5-6]
MSLSPSCLAHDVWTAAFSLLPAQVQDTFDWEKEPDEVSRTTRVTSPSSLGSNFCPASNKKGAQTQGAAIRLTDDDAPPRRARLRRRVRDGRERQRERAHASQRRARGLPLPPTPGSLPCSAGCSTSTPSSRAV